MIINFGSVLFLIFFWVAAMVLVAIRFLVRYAATQLALDWYCFYYFVRNSLVALMEALGAQMKM